MSRTWKDKRKHELGSAAGAFWRKRRAEQALRVAAAQKNAQAAGFTCAACWLLSQLRPGLMCGKHGGGVAELLRAQALAEAPPKKKKARKRKRIL